MPWPGGKSGAGVYHRLCAEIPPHDVRVSPFLGHCAVMRHLRPAALNFGIDRDTAALDLWRGFDWQGAGKLQLIHGCGIEWLKNRFGLNRYPLPDVVHPEQVLAAVYGGGNHKGHEGHKGASGPLRVLRDLRGSTPVPFVLVDPPYPVETLSSGVCPYKFGLTTDQHVELLRVVRTIPALVMILSYPNPLYASELHEWRTFKYRAFTRRGARWEQAWCNYPRPLVLHDWRFAGKDRRQRERIARRVRNWRRLFARIGPAERAGILEQLVAVQTEAAACESVFAVVCNKCLTVRQADVPRCGVCGAHEATARAARVFADAAASHESNGKKVHHGGTEKARRTKR
jgi:DNA adenine methylase